MNSENFVNEDLIKNYQPPWYLSMGFIALWFVGAMYIAPAIVGIVLIAMRYQKDKDYKAESIKLVDRLGSANEIIENKNSIIREANIKRTSILDDAEKELQSKIKLDSKYQAKLDNLKLELKTIEDAIYDKDVFPEEDYSDITSEEIKNKLSILKLDQKKLAEGSDALVLLDGFDSDPKRVSNNNIKQILRCFNAECSHIISKVTAKNINSSRNAIVRAFEQLNKIFKTDYVNLSNEYLNSKLEELNMVHSFALKKEFEKELRQAAKEQLIEEEKVIREIDAAKRKIEKEESQFKNEVNKLLAYMQKATNDIEKSLYINKITELEEKLKLLEKDKEDVLQREQNTRAGFVYVISNIGSFGEDVYKIGMTRRLEPMDRIKELSSASVPFSFDVHAMIFSEDAPSLEADLHNYFKSKEVNKVNARKEFFKVSLDDIESHVKENYNDTVEFIKIPDAYEYRETLNINGVV